MQILIFICLTSIGVFGILFFIQNQKSFPKKKEEIMNLYSSVLSDMNIDFRSGTIDPINIQKISESIQHFAKEIESLTEKMRGESPENQKWLMSIIIEFTQTLNLWIDRHADELETLSQNIESRKSKEGGEKAILTLVSKRLENQRNLFEKM